MNLWYIAIGLDDKSFSTDESSEFGYRTSYISNYLSKQIRRARFKTDGTFQMVYVEATDKPGECAIVPDRALTAQVSFDKERYEQIKGTAYCEFYLGILEKGFAKAAEFKKIPLETLLNHVDEFRKSGCRNEWLHKKKRFREADIEVVLSCFFTTIDFRLVATVNRISTKEGLCSGTILRTFPDEIHFDHMFKDILVDDKNIIVTDFLDRPNILIDLRKALDNQLVSEILPRFGSCGLLPIV